MINCTALENDSRGTSGYIGQIAVSYQGSGIRNQWSRVGFGFRRQASGLTPQVYVAARAQESPDLRNRVKRRGLMRPYVRRAGASAPKGAGPAYRHGGIRSGQGLTHRLLQ